MSRYNACINILQGTAKRSALTYTQTGKKLQFNDVLFPLFFSMTNEHEWTIVSQCLQDLWIHIDITCSFWN